MHSTWLPNLTAPRAPSQGNPKPNSPEPPAWKPLYIITLSNPPSRPGLGFGSQAVGACRCRARMRALPPAAESLGRLTPVHDVAGPAVGGGHGGVELGVSVHEPLRPRVVEVGQGPLLERGRRLLVMGYRMRRIADDGFPDPRHPLGRVEPAVLQFDEPRGPPKRWLERADRSCNRWRGCPVRVHPGRGRSRRSCCLDTRSVAM